MFRFRLSMMVIVFIFWVWIHCLRPIFPFPSRTFASEYGHDDWQQPASIVDPTCTAQEPCRFYTFEKHVSFEHSMAKSHPMITSRREGNFNKQTKLMASNAMSRIENQDETCWVQILLSHTFLPWSFCTEKHKITLLAFFLKNERSMHCSCA